MPIPREDRDCPHAEPPIFLLTAIRNEAVLIGNFLSELHQVLKDAGLLGRVRLVIVNDASTDGTAEVLTREAFSRPDIALEVLTLESNRGNQAAMAWGLRRILPRLGKAHLLTFDADGEDDITQLPRLAKMLDEDPSRIVFVYRDGRSESLLIRLFYLAYKVIYRLLAGQRIIPCNMMAIPGAFAPAIAGSPLLPLHFSYPPLRLGLPYHSMGVARRHRYGGRSSQNLGMLIQHGLIGLTIFYEQLVSKLILVSAGAVALTAVLGGVIIFLRFFSTRTLPVGFATAVFVSLLGFSYLSLVLLVVFSITCATLKLVSEQVRDP